MTAGAGRQGDLLYERVLCPESIVVDRRLDPGRPWEPVFVYLRDTSSEWPQERLGSLLDYRTCGSYDVRILRDETEDASCDETEYVWEIVVSHRSGHGAVVLSYFGDHDGCWRRFWSATEELLAETLTEDAPCFEFWWPAVAS